MKLSNEVIKFDTMYEFQVGTSNLNKNNYPLRISHPNHETTYVVHITKIGGNHSNQKKH